MFRAFILVLTMLTGERLVEDLSSRWQVEDGSKWRQPIEGESYNTIHFALDTWPYRGHRLVIDNQTPCTFFADGRLIGAGEHLNYDLDSLGRKYGRTLRFAVHADKPLSNLRTEIIANGKWGTLNDLDARERAGFAFRDFAITGAGLMLFFFVILMRAHPQLTLDYLSFAKIFSVAERNERLLISRITSSANLLFYVFSALLAGFLLTTVFHYAGVAFESGSDFTIHGFGSSWRTWMKLSAFVLLSMLFKLVIVAIFSNLYNFRDTISFQFFNFLRFILFTAVVLAIMALIYFMAGGESAGFYYTLVVVAMVLLSLGSVMVLIKLMARSPFSLFHLFSYLCASEIIPLVIIIRIFF